MVSGSLIQGGVVREKIQIQLHSFGAEKVIRGESQRKE